MSQISDDSPVWLITGCSSGFGREIAAAVVRRGWRAVITARNIDSISDLATGVESKVLLLRLDVVQPDQIEAAVKAAMERFGRIDVLCNNAGYGYQSTIEEGEDSKIRAEFDVNVFGLFAMTRAVLPIMRAQKSGHIINISSVGGLIGFACSGYYAASKHAVEGWSDSLAAEGKPLGIRVTCVEPGPFRTDWAGRSLQQQPNLLADYASTAGKRLAGTLVANGKQPGDPVRAAEAILNATLSTPAPRHLVLGAWGYDVVVHRMNQRLAEIEAHKGISLGTDYPAEEQD